MNQHRKTKLRNYLRQKISRNDKSHYKHSLYNNNISEKTKQSKIIVTVI